jgi:Acetyltransferase (GNAT) family
VVRSDESHAGTYEQDIGTDSAATFQGRLGGESRCYLVLDGERALHATWVTTTASWVRELRRYFRPPAGSAYIYESFTRADARGRGVYPLALKGISDDLHSDGIEEAWVAVEEDNPPSLKAITKAGFQESFRVAYKRRLGMIRVEPPAGPRADVCSLCFPKKVTS